MERRRLKQNRKIWSIEFERIREKVIRQHHELKYHRFCKYIQSEKYKKAIKMYVELDEVDSIICIKPYFDEYRKDIEDVLYLALKTLGIRDDFRDHVSTIATAFESYTNAIVNKSNHDPNVAYVYYSDLVEKLTGTNVSFAILVKIDDFAQWLHLIADSYFNVIDKLAIVDEQQYTLFKNSTNFLALLLHLENAKSIRSNEEHNFDESKLFFTKIRNHRLFPERCRPWFESQQSFVFEFKADKLHDVERIKMQLLCSVPVLDEPIQSGNEITASTEGGQYDDSI